MKNLKINKTKIKTLALSELILVSNTIERKYDNSKVEITEYDHSENSKVKTKSVK